MRSKPQSVTLQLDSGSDGVSVRRLISKMRALLSVLIELDIQMSEDQRKTARWVVAEASYNSPLTMRFEQRSLRGRTANPKVPKVCVDGLKQLAKGSVEPPYFTPRIMQSAKRVFEGGEKSARDVAVSVSGVGKVKATKKIVKNIETVLRDKYYQEYTTIEGKLDAINIHSRLDFSVYDDLTDKPVSCRFRRDQYDKAYGALGRRVAVTGMVTFNRRDEPVSMDVDDLGELDQSGELPLFLEGEEIDLTGGIDSVEFIRRGRDAE